MEVTDGRQLQILARDRRLTQGLSQAALASQAGVSRKWVSEFERGKTSADLALVLRLLGVLGLRIQVIYPLDDAGAAPPTASGHAVDLDAHLDGGQS
jgi:HTH-type transcriptional regulator/antitoxin HipB